MSYKASWGGAGGGGSSGLNYRGVWNAATNTPTLASSVGAENDWYLVSVGGTTSLNGISNWGAGDWAIFKGGVWTRVPAAAAGVSSVAFNGGAPQAGAVVIAQVQSDLSVTDPASPAFVKSKNLIPVQLTYNGSSVNSLVQGSNVSFSLTSGALTISATGGGGSLNLTTTGTSGPASYSGGTLNVPQYQGAITFTTNGSGAATFNNSVLNIPTYVLPIASSTLLGGIKVGSGLSIDAVTGTLSSAGVTVNSTPVSNIVNSSAANNAITWSVNSGTATGALDPTKGVVGTSLQITDSSGVNGVTVSVASGTASYNLIQPTTLPTATGQVLSVTSINGQQIGLTWSSGGSGSGSVTSVGLSLPSNVFAVTGSPITSSGTLTATLNTQTAGLVFAGPGSGAASAPGFRTLVGTDLPLPSATTRGGIVANVGSAGQFVNGVDPSTGQLTYATPSGSGGGTVNSVGLSMTSEFTVTGSPVTSSGVLTVTKTAQAPNQIWAGPTTGPNAVPVFRSLVSADLPLATASAVGAVKPGTNVTVDGTGTLNVSTGAGLGFTATGTGPATYTGGTLNVPNNEVLYNSTHVNSIAVTGNATASITAGVLTINVTGSGPVVTYGDFSLGISPSGSNPFWSYSTTVTLTTALSNAQTSTGQPTYSVSGTGTTFTGNISVPGSVPVSVGSPTASFPLTVSASVTATMNNSDSTTTPVTHNASVAYYVPLLYKTTGNSSNPNFTTSDSYVRQNFASGGQVTLTVSATTDYGWIAVPGSTARTFLTIFGGFQIVTTPDVTISTQTISGQTYTYYGFTGIQPGPITIQVN